MSNDADEWQVATGGKRNRRRQYRPKYRASTNRSSKVAEIIASEGSGAFNGNPNPQLSVSDIAANHTRLTKSWRLSDAASKLQWLFSQQVANHAPIDTAVCLGLGSFDPGEDRSNWQRSSHIQLEAFLVILRVLEKRHGKKIKSYAQDPAYVANDKEYLKTLDIETVENPEAFNHVNSRTFVYGMHLPHIIWNEVLRDDLPSLCVGICLSKLEGIIDFRPELRNVLQNIKRIRGMAGSYDKLEFPQTDGDYTFHASDIYWRKKVDVDADAITDGLINESTAEQRNGSQRTSKPGHKSSGSDIVKDSTLMNGDAGPKTISGATPKTEVIGNGSAAEHTNGDREKSKNGQKLGGSDDGKDGLSARDIAPRKKSGNSAPKSNGLGSEGHAEKKIRGQGTIDYGQTSSSPEDGKGITSSSDSQ